MKKRLLIILVSGILPLSLLADDTYGSKVTPDRGNTVDVSPTTGTSFTLTPHEADGWKFTQWDDGNTDNPRTVPSSALTGSSHEYKAEFEDNRCELYDKKLDNPSYGGLVSAERSATCECEWTLTATPFTGFAFKGWDDGNTDNPRTVYIDADAWTKKDFKALFERPECSYKPHYSATGGGSVKAELTDACECDWTITATPEEGWTFLRWDDGNTDNPRSINAFYDAETYTAVFEDHRCALFEKKIENPAFGGTVTAVRGTCECDWTLTATPAAGYRFLEWNDGKKTNPRDTTLNPNTAKHVLTATFVPADGLVDAWTADGKAIVRTNALDLDNTTATIITGGTKRAEGQALTREDAGYWSFAASLNAYKGESLRIAFYDECDQLVAVIDTVVPYVVSADADLSSLSVPANADLQVVSGTLTVDADATIAALDIYGGAKTVVPDDKTLNVSSVYMRADAKADAYPQLVANGSLVNANSDTVYYDYGVDYKDYYPLAVPYEVDCSKIRTRSGKPASYEAYWYNGDDRAANASGWTVFNDAAAGAKFRHGTGYILYAVPWKWKSSVTGTVTRQQKAVVRFPMKADLSFGEGEKSTTLSLYGGAGTNTSNLNWNFIANPYLADYTQGDDGLLRVGTYDPDVSTPGTECYGYVTDAVRYVTYTTDGYLTYVQARAGTHLFRSFHPFFVQAESAGTLTFTLSDRRQNAPRKMSNVQSQMSNEIAFGIVLRSAERTDHTGLLYGEGFTDGYELNADLVKMSGSTPVLELYSLADTERRAFNALAMADIRTTVPLGYANAPMGQMTIAFDTGWYDPAGLQAVMLTDYETGRVVNLLEEDYTFTNHAPSSDNRFALHAVLAPQVATGLNDPMVNDRMVNEDGVFDLLGRRVTTDMLPQGVYIIVGNGVSRKEVVR